MADIIRLLPDSLANQIAAGEVIQRPASAVKELLENAIDAGATKIQLLIKDAGKTLIQVIDNGSGMTETDARMSFERHATSKIKKSEDLEAIKTMGFRGEALASIAAVAQVELKTRTADKDLGTKISIAGSVLNLQELVQTPVGTSFAVHNLFFNVPARRKFLKSDPVELKNILEEFEHVAMAYPEVEMVCFNNDSEIYNLPKGNLKQRVIGVFGKAIAEKIVSVDEQTDLVNIGGFVGKVDAAKKKRGDQYLFVNRRFIKSTYLHHAIKSAYESLIGEEDHPFYVLFLEIEPSRIDVNVHPSKHEIKFLDERIIYQYIRVAVRHALGQYVPLSLDFESGEKAITEQIASVSYSHSQNENKVSGFIPPSKSITANQDWRLLYEGLKKQNIEKIPSQSSIILSSKIDSGENAETFASQLNQDNNDYDLVTKAPYQLHATYIISPIASGFLVIDQQAAHQRIVYDQALVRFSGTPVASQQSLFPTTVQFSGSDQVLMESLLPHLKQLGFDIEYFGANNFIIHGTPTDWNEQDSIKQFLETIIREITNDTGQRIDHKTYLARHLARFKSLKHGQSLSVDEMNYLIDQLFACTDAAWSPFGNKCFTAIELGEIEKRLK